MKFIIDQNGNKIFDGTLPEIQGMFVFVAMFEKHEIQILDNKVLEILKDVDFKEEGKKNEEKN